MVPAWSPGDPVRVLCRRPSLVVVGACEMSNKEQRTKKAQFMKRKRNDNEVEPQGREAGQFMIHN